MGLSSGAPGESVPRFKPERSLFEMDAVRSPIWLHKVSDVFGSPRLVNHSCSLKEEIDFIVQTSTKSVGGIKLSDLEGGL